MALRLPFALLGVALALGGAALACTTTTIVEKAAPAAPDDEAGTAAAEPGATDGGTDTDASFVFKAAPPGTFAQAVSFGGSVVKAPKVVPILFAGDDQQATLTSFTAKLATGTYWGQISAEYGVGALVVKAPIVVPESAPATIDDSQIASWLTSKFTSDPARFGAPDAQTLYLFYYPSGTTVTQGSGTGCAEFGGYHFETTAGATPIGYAVVPRCPAQGGRSATEVTTEAATHELLEWATDPFPESRPAYMSVDDAHAVWGRVFLGELGDLCAQDAPAYPADLGYTVTRSWSNASAKAGHAPCVPAPQSPYFTAFPAKPDLIPVTDFVGRAIQTQGFRVGVGQSKTIDLTLYSDGPMAAWSVQVMDLTAIRGAGGPPEFSYTLDRSKGTSGETLKLTIKGETAASQGQGFLLISETPRERNFWPVWVTN
jgi:hypothetical protein